METKGHAQVIAVVNGKGGVGKTTTTANLAGILALDPDQRICVVDMDAQGDLSLDLGVADRIDNGDELHQAGLAGRAPKPLRDVRDRLDLVAGGAHLEDLAAALDARRRTGRDADGLTRALQELAGSGEYDAVIIDCPPGGHVLQESVLRAARWLLVPAKTDAGSLNGLAEIARRFTAARATNPDLTLLGVFLFDVGTSSRRVLREARESLLAVLEGAPPETVLSTTIRHVEAAAKAARDYGLLAHELEEAAAAGPKWYEVRSGSAPAAVPPSSGGLASDYHALTVEVLERIQALAGAR